MRGAGAKLLAGRFSRAEKVRRRKRINLDDAALADATRTRYFAALRKLLKFVHNPDGFAHLDDLICDWIRKMWKEGEPLLTIGDGLSALHYYEPVTRRQIPHAWKLFSVWRRVEIPSRAPPLTWVLVKAFAAYFLEQGLLELATVFMVAFHCLLRTGEFLQLMTDDIILGKQHAIISLRGAKSGRRNAANEMVSITDPLVLMLVTDLIEFKRKQNLGNTYLYSWSAAQFRKAFKQVCTRFGLQSHAFRPYSLRRGGATDFFQRTQSMEATLIRGRWESSKVARVYITDGLSYLPSIKLSPHTAQMMNKYKI